MDAVVLGKVNDLKKEIWLQNYTSFNKVINNIFSQTFTEVINITGEGFITELIAYRGTYSASTKKPAFLKVTVDGVLTFAMNFISYADTSNRYYGFSGFSLQDYVYYSNGYKGIYNNTYPSMYQYYNTFNEIDTMPYIEAENANISNSQYGVVYLSSRIPLLFKNSLKVEVKSLDSDSNTKIGVECRGGLKI